MISGAGDPSVGPELAKLPYLSVVLQVLADTPQSDWAGALRALGTKLRGTTPPSIVTKAQAFRLRTMDSGRLVRVDRSPRAQLEHAIAGWGRLSIQPRGGGIEFWVSRRRDSRFISLGVRLDVPGQAKVPKGALSPHLSAALVCWIEPRPSDVFLDPFAGSGAIPAARARYEHRELLVGETDPDAIGVLRTKQRNGAFGPNSRVRSCDFLDADAVRRTYGSAGVDRVITDPPWGFFAASQTDIDAFHRTMWLNMDSVVRPGGQIAILTARVESALRSIDGTTLEIQSMSPVLVNGKKASVVVVRK